jgi:hypothetical protein
MVRETSTTESSEKLTNLLIRIIGKSREPGGYEDFYTRFSSKYICHTAIDWAYRIHR